jgi:hypothetical protein
MVRINVIDVKRLADAAENELVPKPKIGKVQNSKLARSRKNKNMLSVDSQTYE